ncbi:MAG: SMC-Scp complex subunit ScpB, partial [Candidatus Bathyarchaeia archaeon]
SEVVLMRGKHAYTHIKDLERMGLIECKTSGRQKIIVTTEFFSDYFGLSRNLSVLKEQLRKILLSGEEVT